MKYSFSDFFGENSLSGFKYFYYLPNLNWKKKTEFSNKIQQNKGKNTFSLSHDCVIIIENSKSLSSPTFLSYIKDFGSIILFSDNHIEEIPHNSTEKTKKPIRVIVMSDLISVIELYGEKDISFHFSKGLPEEIDSKGLISLFYMQKGQKVLKYHQFNKIFNDINNYSSYDIPYYHIDLPQGFSLFSTDYEKVKIEDYEKKRVSRKETKKHYIDTDNKREKILRYYIEQEKIDFNVIQEPRPEHFYCQLCCLKFEDYIEHTKSKGHQNKIYYNQSFYNRIKKTFERISGFHNNKNNSNLKEESPKKNNGELLLLQNMQTNNEKSVNNSQSTENDNKSTNNSIYYYQLNINSLSTNTNTFNEFKKSDLGMEKEFLKPAIQKIITINKKFEKRKFSNFSETQNTSMDYGFGRLTRKGDPLLMEKLKKCLRKTLKHNKNKTET